MKLDRTWLDWLPKGKTIPDAATTCSPPVQSASSCTANSVLWLLDEGTRSEVQTFINVLGAHTVTVVPQGTSDPAMAGSVGWREWERQRLSRIFVSGRRTPEEVEERAAKAKGEQNEALHRWRQAGRGWLKWLRFFQSSPEAADRFRREREDGQLSWLLQLASQRTPLTGVTSRKTKV